MANWLVTLDFAKARCRLGTLSAADTILLSELIDEASRSIEDYCQRRFIPSIEARIFDIGEREEWLALTDLLAVTEVAIDRDLDASYAEVWAASDYYLLPANVWPKTSLIVAPDGDYALFSGRAVAKVTGTWGYGDGQSANPWASLGIAGTIGATGTTLTPSAAGLEVGQTIKMGDEMLFVTAVVSTPTLSATVERAINGSTAAAHMSAVIYEVAIAATIRQACGELVRRAWIEITTGMHPETIGERTGNLSYQRFAPEQWDMRMRQMLGRYQRLAVA